jgi:hypothetical protein
MHWSVVSLKGGPADGGADKSHGAARGHSVQSVEPMATDPDAAKTALERITIPRDALDRIAAIASPRSSLIISDEELSSETGKDTEFVVLMSGEPQGGIKFRRGGPVSKVQSERPRDRRPFAGPILTGENAWPTPSAGEMGGQPTKPGAQQPPSMKPKVTVRRGRP